jgi:murein DD-endopeptidase MepM/ murein hydrolase activator NlpD
MDDNGKSFDGDNKSLHSYFCYGKNILAPADGTVVSVSNRHVDSRVSGEKVYCDTWDIRGNFVVIKHAEKEYSASAHLVPGSITVRKGDKVSQGQVIGKCGNSGNTSEPHLHFQLQTGKSFFLSAGLPISFVNINAQEKTNYGMADSRGAQKEVLEASGIGRVYIGRGLEVENQDTCI